MSTKKGVRKNPFRKGLEAVGIPGVPGGSPRGDRVDAPQEWFPRTTPLSQRLISVNYRVPSNDRFHELDSFTANLVFRYS